MRHRFDIAVAAIAFAICQPAIAESPLQRSLQQSVDKAAAASASGQIVIIMRFLKADNASLDATAASAQRLAALLAKQPGYVDGQFLRNANPDGEPNFLHVTRWQSFEDWERLFTNAEVSAEMERESPFVLATGSAFVPLNR